MTTAFISHSLTAATRAVVATETTARFLSSIDPLTSTSTSTIPITLPSGSTFEPVIPDASTLIGFGSIVVLSALAVYIWANQVVPVSRTNLAISKRSGAVKEYLEELQSSATDNSNTESSNRVLERWLFTDWLQSSERKKGRQKEPALPILKSAKWNSGDNPVLAATALILLGVILTSITERVANIF